MSPTTPDDSPRLPPRWVIRTIWRAHRALARRLGSGRWSLSEPVGAAAGLLRLRTTGRRTGVERAVIVSYIRRNADFVTLAMNGWDPAQPAWWLNLQTIPLATVDLPAGSVAVRASRAEGAEREELWRLCAASAGWGRGLDRFARRRPAGTDVVILTPVTAQLS